jgi:hypothetical protein
MKKLRNMNYKPTFILLIFLIIISNNTFSQIYSQSKTVNKGYAINKFTKVEITNKYGEVKILESKVDSAVFEIKVYAETTSPEKLDEIIKSIDFKFNNTNYYLTAETVFESDKSLFSDLKKLSEMVISSENVIKVDYTIYLPSYIDVKIDNKFGDIYIENLKKELTVTLQNGNFKADNLEGNCILDFNFCNNVVLNNILSGKINIDYSEVKIKNAEQLNIISKSTEVEIENINILNIDSKRDKYKIQKINYLYGETYFTDFDVDELSEEISLNLKYGEIEMEKILSTFSLIDFTSIYTDIVLKLETGSSYIIDLTNADAELDLDEKISKLEEKILENGSTNIYGTIGSSGKSKIKLNLQGGSLTIDYK